MVVCPRASSVVIHFSLICPNRTTRFPPDGRPESHPEEKGTGSSTGPRKARAHARFPWWSGPPRTERHENARWVPSTARMRPWARFFAAPQPPLTCAGRSPPSVLDGIPLSGLPWPPAGVSSATFGLAPHGSAVSSRFPSTSRSPHHRAMGRVSFLFWSRPSPVAPPGAVRPAAREELPQEIPVARPPARVNSARLLSSNNRFPVPLPKGS